MNKNYEKYLLKYLMVKNCDLRYIIGCKKVVFLYDILAHLPDLTEHELTNYTEMDNKTIFMRTEICSFCGYSNITYLNKQVEPLPLNVNIVKLDTLYHSSDFLFLYTTQHHGRTKGWFLLKVETLRNGAKKLCMESCRSPFSRNV